MFFLVFSIQRPGHIFLHQITPPFDGQPGRLRLAHLLHLFCYHRHLAFLAFALARFFPFNFLLLPLLENQRQLITRNHRLPLHRLQLRLLDSLPIFLDNILRLIKHLIILILHINLHAPESIMLFLLLQRNRPHHILCVPILRRHLRRLHAFKSFTRFLRFILFFLRFFFGRFPPSHQTFVPLFDFARQQFIQLPFDVRLDLPDYSVFRLEESDRVALAHRADLVR